MNHVLLAYSTPWLWFVAFGISLGSGALAVFLLPLSRRWLRLLVSAVYMCLMAVALLFVSLYSSCLNGDCL
jgi:hypothetical protein